MKIEQDQKSKEGFLLQMAPDQYFCAIGPFSKGSLLYAPPFFSSFTAKEGYKAYYHSFFSKAEILNFLSSKDELGINLATLPWKEPSFSAFQSFFSKALKEIKEKRLQKIVPVLFETAEYMESIKLHHLELVSRLISRSEDERGFVYAYWSNEKLVLGQTPEYLFRKEGYYVQSMALAGTARDVEHNLKEDSKEILEHQLVVDAIQNLLEPLGECRKSPTYVQAVGDIRHLRTNFKLLANRDLSFRELCSLLHPTPALGGVPRERALKLLYEFHQNSHLRHGFGSPFGVQLKEKAFCIVAIRNILFIKGRAYLGSGCGLVKDSELDREWEELKKKRQVIKNILF